MDKKRNVPALDFSKIKRRNSDSEINTHHKTLKRKDIDEVIIKHRETCIFIKEIRNKLEQIENSTLFNKENETHKTVKDILDKISNLEKTPRIISRCDAMVGNTQIIISNTKQSLDYLKSIDNEAEQHDIITITMLSDMFKELHEIKKTVQQIKDRLFLE